MLQRGTFFKQRSSNTSESTPPEMATRNFLLLPATKESMDEKFLLKILTLVTK